VSVIQILDDADAAFRILGAGLRTVLSVTTMFADKPHRLNGRTSAQRFCVLTILPPVPHSRLGYPRSGLSRSDFVPWHLADLLSSAVNVCFRGWSRLGKIKSLQAQGNHNRSESVGATVAGPRNQI
jgi:hypothetical protein